MTSCCALVSSSRASVSARCADVTAAWRSAVSAGRLASSRWAIADVRLPSASATGWVGQKTSGSLAAVQRAYSARASLRAAVAESTAACAATRSA